MHGWTEAYYECSCGFIGKFRIKNSKKHCPRCSSKKGKKIFADDLQKEYKTPIRKFKSKCGVCGRRCIGKRCKKCYDAKLAWTKEKREEQSEKIKQLGIKPPKRKKREINNVEVGITREEKAEEEIKKKLGHLMDDGD